MAGSETGFMCSFSRCKIGGQLTEDTPRVEVKTFLPSATLKELKVNWDAQGEAAFHDKCWLTLLKACKGRDDEGLNIHPEERDMVVEANKTAEYFDSVTKIQKEAAKIAMMLRQASHAIAFTGAGISTAAGIGDFRGKSGKWTTNDRQKDYGSKFKVRRSGFSYTDLRPTYTHEAICKLVEMGILKHLTSQNCDGLHRLSGISRQKISELHGNCFEAHCESCDARVDYPYPVRTLMRGMPNHIPCPTCGHCHRTGNRCHRQGCNGFLMNTVINFGDSLESHVIGAATDHAKKADLVLALGSTLRVTPACELVEMGKKPVRLVLCNRQPTPYDSLCVDGPGSRIYGDCDALMREVMRHLLGEEEVQEWEEGREDRLEHYAKLRSES